MGIRIHKFLGWGLTDVQPKDERINWNSWLLSYEGAPEPEEYLAWLEPRRDGVRFTLDYAHLKHLPPPDGKWNRERDLTACAVHRDEYGLPEVLALRPLAHPDWSRFDDAIDWMEETYPWSDETSQQNRVKVYDHGPWPHNAAYMDKRDGRALPGAVLPWWRLLNTKVAPGTRQMDEAFGALDIFAREMGFSGHEEAKANVVAEVPQEIRDLAEFGQLFTHAGVWRQLRPLLYIYWC